MSSLWRTFTVGLLSYRRRLPTEIRNEFSTHSPCEHDFLIQFLWVAMRWILRRQHRIEWNFTELSKSIALIGGAYTHTFHCRSNNTRIRRMPCGMCVRNFHSSIHFPLASGDEAAHRCSLCIRWERTSSPTVFRKVDEPCARDEMPAAKIALVMNY